jgi:hypothetical protein
LDGGADPNLLNSKRSYPSRFFNGCYDNDLEILQILLEAGANPDPEDSTKRIQLRCLKNLELRVSNGMDVNKLSLHSYSPRLYPIGFPGNPETPLPESKKNELSGNKLWTPIMIYAYNYPEQFESCLFLFKHGAKVNYKDENGVDLKMVLEVKAEDYKINNGNVPSDLAELLSEISQK